MPRSIRRLVLVLVLSATLIPALFTSLPAVSAAAVPSAVPSAAPNTDAPPRTRAPTSSPRPSRELSQITVLGDGWAHTVGPDDGDTYVDEVLSITRSTEVTLVPGGRVVAPDNFGGSLGWPAVRVNDGSTLNVTGGRVEGSTATGVEWRYRDGTVAETPYPEGGDAVHLNNGGGTNATASVAEFRGDVVLRGGDALWEGGIGGSALFVNGDGTRAWIYGGVFSAGIGGKADGSSLIVQNRAAAHVRSGTFLGEVEVIQDGSLHLYGCFRYEDDDLIYGRFTDGTQLTGLDVTLRRGGRVELISVAEQDCDGAPSITPTNTPTVSMLPTVTNSGTFFRGGGRIFARLLLAATMVALTHCGQ